MNNTLLIVLTGILAGTIHVLSGPDHLAAIAPLTAHQPQRSWKIGLSWGMGHTTSVWIIAIIVFLMKGFIPLNGLSQWSEKFVGIILIGLGLWSIQKVFRKNIYYHSHPSDQHIHPHFHLHHNDAPTASKNHTHKHAPMGIGVIHGLSGSSHLIAILPALALPGQFKAFGYIAGFGIGTILAMIGFAWAIGFFLQKIIHKFSNLFLKVQLSFAFLAIGVGIFWLVNN